MNHTDCHLKWQNSSRDAKVIGGQSKDSLSTRVITWARLIVMFIIEPKMGLYFEHVVQFQLTRIFLVSVLKHKFCHIPLKYWCFIKQSDHIWPTYLDTRICLSLPVP